jgi:LemA protein
MKSTYTPGSFGIISKVFGSNEMDEPISKFGGSWRAKEHRLKVGDRVFITAQAHLTPEGDAVQLARTDARGKSHLFELSVGDEKAAISAYASPVMIVVTALAALAFTAFGGNGLHNGATVWFPLMLVVAAFVLYLVGMFNRVRRARERCVFAWSLIDVASEQLATTIPELQAVVGAAFDHEQSALTAVAAARNLGRAPTSAGAGAVRAADAATGQLVALVEHLPTLHTQPNVAQLMHQITLLTDRVAFGRRFYNDSVLRLADRLSQFPDSLFARLGGVRPLPYIDDLDPPQAPPPVRL